MRKFIIGVMGPGAGAREIDIKNAYDLGKLIAREGWIVLSGGRNAGVMDAVSRGAREAGGLTIGIIPDDHAAGISPAVDIPIITGMGGARNNINVLSSDLVIACGMGCGTASEIALALKAGKHVIQVNPPEDGDRFFQNLDPERVQVVKKPQEAIAIARERSAVLP